MANTNITRSAAKAALDEYRRRPGNGTVSTPEAVHDLIVDLLHWADLNVEEVEGRSGDELLDEAIKTYYHEVETIVVDHD